MVGTDIQLTVGSGEISLAVACAIDTEPAVVTVQLTLNIQTQIADVGVRALAHRIVVRTQYAERISRADWIALNM